MDLNDADTPEDILGAEEERNLSREVLDWLLLEVSAHDETGVAFQRAVQVQRERGDVAFSAIAQACDVVDESPARMVRERFFDLLRKQGIKVGPNMSREKLFTRYRELRVKSTA